MRAGRRRGRRRRRAGDRAAGPGERTSAGSRARRRPGSRWPARRCSGPNAAAILAWWSSRRRRVGYLETFALDITPGLLERRRRGGGHARRAAAVLPAPDAAPLPPATHAGPIPGRRARPSRGTPERTRRRPHAAAVRPSLLVVATRRAGRLGCCAQPRAHGPGAHRAGARRRVPRHRGLPHGARRSRPGSCSTTRARLAESGLRYATSVGDEIFMSRNEALLGHIDLLAGDHDAAAQQAATAPGPPGPQRQPAPDDHHDMDGPDRGAPCRRRRRGGGEAARAVRARSRAAPAARTRSASHAPRGLARRGARGHRRRPGGTRAGRRASTIRPRSRSRAPGRCSTSGRCSVRRGSAVLRARRSTRRSPCSSSSAPCRGQRARGTSCAGSAAGGRPGDELTEAERRVAELAATGHRNKEIAARLVVEVGTVEAHLSRVYRKLGVRSRTRARGAPRTTRGRAVQGVGVPRMSPGGGRT